MPRDDKQLLVIVETDGCFVDGLDQSTYKSNLILLRV
jgi:formylmethanofuran dehydrogenase subunit E